MNRLFVLATIFIGACPLVGSGADHLPPGGTLKPGEQLTSKNGRFSLVMQGDGNLVLYLGETVLWNSETCGAEATFCAMQGDGNLVVYETCLGVVNARWASDTWQHPGGRLVCQDDGNLVIYQEGVAVWQSGTAERGTAQLKIEIAFDLIIKVPVEPGKPRPSPPVPRVPPVGPNPKAPVPNARTTVGWRAFKYGKWLLRIGGVVIPVVGWGWLAYEGAVLIYDGGTWLFHQLDNNNDQPNPNQGVIAAAADQPAEWEAIIPMSTGGDTVALLFHTGFLCADTGIDKVLANRQKIGEWERFRVTKHKDGTISLLSLSTGKYLCAVSGGGAGVTADAERIGAWEKFTPEVNNGKLFLKAEGGQYLSARKL